MTLGDGIFWSTVVIVVAGAIYQISVRKRWKLAGRVVGVLILVGFVIGGGIWGWFEYQSRPYIVDQLGGVRLGMKPVQVKLAKGEPTNSHKDPIREEDGTYQMGWGFRESEYSDSMQLVIFFGDTAAELEVGIVCRFGGYGELLGISFGSPETHVIEVLGEPTHVSVASDGLMKQMSYARWQTSYRIRQGKVVALCIARSGRVTFREEYNETVEDEPQGGPA